MDRIKRLGGKIFFDVVGVTVLLVKHLGPGTDGILAGANIKHSALQIALSKIGASELVGFGCFVHAALSQLSRPHVYALVRSADMKKATRMDFLTAFAFSK
jgi:hypothetical protein